MNLDFEDILDTLRENLFTVLAVTIIVLLLIGYLVFTIRTVLPNWRLRTELVTQLDGLEAAYTDRTQQQQATTGQFDQQIEAAQAQFEQSTNQFLTEAQAAAFLERLYGIAATFGVAIVDLQAQAVPQGVAAVGEKPIYDTRQFRLVVVGDLPNLNRFVGDIEDTAVLGVSLKNLLITADETGDSHVLTLDLLLYTSPFSSGEAVAELPEGLIPLPPTPAGTAVPQPTPTATVTAVPDVSSLVEQLDIPWAAEDWPQVIDLIQQIRQQAPNTPEMTEKLYAARVNYGYQLAGLGETAAAVEQFEQALAIFPDGGEAEAGLQSLFAPTTTATPTAIIYVVQRGDTLYSIARRYGSTVDAVKAANGLVNNNISPGQQLIIP